MSPQSILFLFFYYIVFHHLPLQRVDGFMELMSVFCDGDVWNLKALFYYFSFGLVFLSAVLIVSAVYAFLRKILIT